MPSLRSVMTTRVSVTLSRPKSVRKRSWVSGRGGTRFSRGKAMPVASAAPIAMPKLRRSRLPRNTTVGWRLWESMKSPTTPASCGPAGVDVWAGRCAGAATRAPAMRNGSPMCGISASLAMSTLLRGAWAPRAPAVSGPRRAKSNRAGRPDGVTHAEPEGEAEARGQQDRQRGPHDEVPETVRDVAEDHGPQRIAHEEDGAEDADHAPPPGLGSHVHQERRQRRIEEAVGGAGEQSGEEEKRHDGHGHVRPHEERQGGQKPGGDRQDEHGGNDGGAPPARVDEVSAAHAHSHRRDGVGGVEEAHAVHAQGQAECRQEGEHRPGAEAEEEGERHVEPQNLAEGRAQRDEPRSLAHIRRQDAAHPDNEPRRHAAQEHGQDEERVEAQAAHDDLPRDGRQRGPEEARDAVDAERPAATLHRYEIDHVHVVRDEEGGEAQSLNHAESGQQREVLGDEEGGRRDDEQTHAERQEKAAPDAVEPVADHGLAEDAGGAVDALDQADLGFRTAQALDVQRQEDETAETRHEEEIGERRPREGPAGDQLEPADHERCGPLSPRRRMAATMTRVTTISLAMIPVAMIFVAMIFVECSTHGE